MRHWNMGLLVVDENKCKKDGFCAGECPMAIIQTGLGNSQGVSAPLPHDVGIPKV
jgi:heterodisulfide reductase subunit A-like polyferredoxin